MKSDSVAAVSRISKVAIIDDDEDAAKSISLVLEDASFQASRVMPASSDVDQFVAEVVRNYDAVVCDQRLRYGALLDIAGAELASKILDKNIPVVLVTQYLDQEADVSIRRFRNRLPVVLRRSEADEPDELRSAFARCLLEMRGGRQGERKSQRTLLTVADLQSLGDESVVDAVVHGWNHQDAVRFPLSLIPANLRGQVSRGSVLAVESNIQSLDKNQLYFENFEIVPPPDPNDGLA